MASACSHSPAAMAPANPGRDDNSLACIIRAPARAIHRSSTTAGACPRSWRTASSRAMDRPRSMSTPAGRRPTTATVATRRRMARWRVTCPGGRRMMAGATGGPASSMLRGADGVPQARSSGSLRGPLVARRNAGVGRRAMGYRWGRGKGGIQSSEAFPMPVALPLRPSSATFQGPPWNVPHDEVERRSAPAHPGKSPSSPCPPGLRPRSNSRRKRFRSSPPP